MSCPRLTQPEFSLVHTQNAPAAITHKWSPSGALGVMSRELQAGKV